MCACTCAYVCVHTTRQSECTNVCVCTQDSSVRRGSWREEPTTHCNILKYIATYLSEIHRVLVPVSCDLPICVLQWICRSQGISSIIEILAHSNTLQHVEMHCSILICSGSTKKHVTERERARARQRARARARAKVREGEGEGEGEGEEEGEGEGEKNKERGRERRWEGKRKRESAGVCVCVCVWVFVRACTQGSTKIWYVHKVREAYTKKKKKKKKRKHTLCSATLQI